MISAAYLLLLPEKTWRMSEMAILHVVRSLWTRAFLWLASLQNALSAFIVSFAFEFGVQICAQACIAISKYVAISVVLSNLCKIHTTQSDGIASVEDQNSTVTMDISDVSLLFGPFIGKSNLQQQMSNQMLYHITYFFKKSKGLKKD